MTGNKSILKDYRKEQEPLVIFGGGKTGTTKGHGTLGTVVGYKWVFRNKPINKASLVAKGYSQEEGIDFDETFAPVARLEVIRMFLACAAYQGLKVYQMDVKNAFLNEKLQERVYIEQPPGFEDSEYLGYVYRLDKALYGLKQAPRAWYETHSTFLCENKFERVKVDTTLILKKHKEHILLDIQYAVCVCARYQFDPKESNYTTVKRILRYLKGTPNLGVCYPKESDFTLIGFSDVDFAGCRVDKKSTSGTCQFIGPRLISWFNKKQTTVSTSTAETDYIVTGSYAA
ncbi:Retrovirus-related Pol polyprotein from transposon RE2-like protein [Drosera capensis]